METFVVFPDYEKRAFFTSTSERIFWKDPTGTHRSAMPDQIEAMGGKIELAISDNRRGGGNNEPT